MLALAALPCLNAFFYGIGELPSFPVEDITNFLHQNKPELTLARNTPLPSPITATSMPPPVLFLNMTDLGDEDDIFSAAWWQTTERFLSVNLTLIKNVEGDAIIAVKRGGRGMEDALKTRDYLDFSIEHLSKWWRMTEAPGILYATLKLKDYIQRSVAKRDTSLMNATLALIPYGVGDGSNEKRMWKTSLSATIVSLLKQGVPRVVVVGTFDTDAVLAAQVFTELSMDKVEPSKQFETVMETTRTELAYVHTDDVESEFVKINVPKGALHGLRDALVGDTDPTPYLGKGDKGRFRYIYLTEADQILNARLTTDFLDLLDDGRIIIPHRLQPIPHSYDVNQMVHQNRGIEHLPPKQTVTFLDAETDGCCDTGGRLKERGKVCGGFWWQCDFHFRETGNFSHLEDYEFISLTQGTGIVSLAATEQSRRCAPAPNSRGCQRLDD